ncbi:hypothetical protein QP992_05400 [Corynebacterium ulcerans]|nr:hypothetical protein [Corynebacterium ulcerans]MBH5295209.1 hypothetical protein [Corynebacterium ulcerans]MDK8888571.1 hypothetical protein [Corynebacterium ulcerans]
MLPLPKLYRQGLRTLIVFVLFSVTASQFHAVSAVEEVDKYSARAAMVDAAVSGGPAQRAVALSALRKGDQEIKEAANQELASAELSDLRYSLSIIAQVGGSLTGQRAHELITNNDRLAMTDFIMGGWQKTQESDDRKEVEKLAQGDSDSVVTSRAKEVLPGNGESLASFLADELPVAQKHDKRRRLYELASSGLPAVSEGAASAIETDDTEVFDQFLEYGQYIAVAKDSEVASVEQLSAIVEQQTIDAQRSFEAAAEQSEIAKRHAQWAADATERARIESEAAREAFGRAETGAQEAGRLAGLAGIAADEAVAAADQAHHAMMLTAEAMSRAASAAAQARMAASNADKFASLAGRDAHFADLAREAAQGAANAQKEVQKSEQAFALAWEIRGHADEASRAATSAAENAKRAAAEADRAANAAGDSSVSAGQARANAAVARAAAARAEAAAARVTGIVVELRTKVEEVRIAVREASDHAKNSAEAAEEAAIHAGLADEAATKSEKFAEEAEQSAKAAEAASQLAKTISDLTRSAIESKRDQEKAQRIELAVARAKVEDKDKQVKAAEEDERIRFEKEKSWALNINSVSNEDLPRIQNFAVDALRFGTPTLAGAAAQVLRVGDDQVLREFVLTGVAQAQEDDQRALAQLWWEQAPVGSELKEEAERVADSSREDVEQFVNVDLLKLREGRLRENVQFLGNAGGTEVRNQADAALESNDPVQLAEFLEGTGYKRALIHDGRIEAYNSLEGTGAETSMAAEVALHGSEKDLIDFFFTQKRAAERLDMIFQARTSYVDAMLDRNYALVAQAKGAAAGARQAAHEARGSAEQAAESAREAEEYAGTARTFAEKAKLQQDIAESHLREGEVSLRRAQVAAFRARNDAQKATADAQRATSYEAEAHLSASEAKESANRAQESATAAGRSAEEAGRIAVGAYNFAIQMQQQESATIQASVDAGVTDQVESLWQIIKEEVGDEALEVIRGLLGIDDIVNCTKGEIQGCLFTALSFVPVGKIAKGIKSAPAIRKLMMKMGTVVNRFKESRAAKLAAAVAPPACAMPRARIRRSTADAGCKVIEAPNGRVYRLAIEKVKASDDLDLITRWDPHSGLANPQVNAGRNFTKDQKDRILELLVDETQKYTNPSVFKAGNKILNRIRERKAPDFRKYSKTNFDEMNHLGVENNMEGFITRGVSQDSYQNALAYSFAETCYKTKIKCDSRVNQALLKKSDRETSKLSTVRPDVQIHYEDAPGVVSFEFDRNAARVQDHVNNLFAADPNAVSILVQMEEASLPPAAKKAIAEFALQRAKTINS